MTHSHEVEKYREQRDHAEIPWQLAGLLTLGLIAGVLGLYGYYTTPTAQAADRQPGLTPMPEPPTPSLVMEFPTGLGTSCLPESFISRPADLAYTDVYFSPGQLDSMPAFQIGRANSYGDGESLNGRTSSGELFDPEAKTAASWFYPLGTWVRVTDIGNGAYETVRINDRGPDIKSYPDVIIDLTRGAMRRLEPVASSARVTVQPVCQ